MVISSMAIDGEGNIYFCTEPSIVGGFCVLTNQGKLRANLAYSQHVMTSEWSAPVIATDGTIYFGGLSFYVLNSDYTLETRFKGIQYGSESTTTIGSDGTLYVGTSKWEDVSTPKMHQVGYLSAAASDGKLKWRYKVGGGIKSSPAIGSDGTVYIGSLDSCVYAIRSDSKGLADSPWPKFQHDNQNTGRAGGGM
jgi:outer membrane protein assembly factor BamB